MALCFSLGQATVAMSLPTFKKPTDLVVSTLSMFILVLFNEYESLTAQQICDKLHLDIDTVRKNLSCLTTPKMKILSITKQDKQAQALNQDEDVDMPTPGESQESSVVAQANVFSVNQAFTTQFLKLSLPLPILEEVYKKEKVVAEREYAIDATIVRIMKTRKQLPYTTLI